jgi:hypothetical protein
MHRRRKNKRHSQRVRNTRTTEAFSASCVAAAVHRSAVMRIRICLTTRRELTWCACPCLVSSGFPSAGSAELSALKAELKAARKATTLLRSPIRTLTIFTVRCCLTLRCPLSTASCCAS